MMTLNEWIINGSVGQSSKTIWSVLQGVKMNNGNKPYDPCDFGRCYELVNQCNILREDLKRVSRRLPYWKPYVDNWEKLTEMYEQNEKENWMNSKSIGMYDLMKKLRAESDLIGRILD
jgi:hypothetical protein